MPSLVFSDPAAAPRLYGQLLKYSRHDAGILENYLTECFAAAITEDALLARCIVEQIVRRPVFAGVRLASATITAYTQVSAGAGCIPDVVLEIASRDRLRIARLALEAKVNANLGIGQLSKYLGRRSLDGVALVARNSISVPCDVYDHRKYFRPPRRDHFFWADLSVSLSQRARTRCSPALTRALQGLFTQLRFRPAPKSIGDLRWSPQLRTKFATRWIETRRVLSKLGWNSRLGSQAQVYVRRLRRTGRLDWALLDPAAPDHCLRVRLNFRSDRTLRQVERELKAGRFFLKRHTAIRQRTVRGRIGGLANVLDLEIPLGELFPDGGIRPGAGGLLLRYLIPLFERADHRVGRG